MSKNPIQQLTEDWQRELPELDVGPMATLAQVNRLSLLVKRRIESALSAAGSSLADFDVLSALRRQGPPFRLMPSELSRSVMLSPSGMTHRIDLLEAAGLVERQSDPTNRRSTPVVLTAEGVRVAESLVEIVVDVQAEALQTLSSAQQSALDQAIGRVLDDLAP